MAAQQQNVPTVKVAVRRQGGQEQQELFTAPVPSSFAWEVLQQQYGPGELCLCLEGSNVVLGPTVELQATERYVYNVLAGVWGPPLALGHHVSVLQTPHQRTVHSGSLVLQRPQHHQRVGAVRVAEDAVPRCSVM
jgi:hypothetical protein